MIEHTLEISIVIPAYQEAENLKTLLPELKQVLDSLTVPYEIIIVDTVTPLDNTKVLCDEQKVLYRQRSPSNSFGDAVRSGIQATQGKYIIFMDGDGSHDPKFIRALYDDSKDFDLVVASRYIEGGHTENSQLLIFMSWVLNVTYSVILGVKLKDISNSFKLYPGDLMRSLKLTSANFNIVQEIIFMLYQKNPQLRAKEIPFTFKKRAHGKTKRKLFFFIVTYIYLLIKMKCFVIVSKYIK